MGARAIRFALFAALLLVGATANIGAAAATPTARTVDVTIVSFAFTPGQVTIDAGDTIRWTNLDSAPHSAVSVRPGFDTVILAQGQTTLTTFDRPGSFEYVCGIHGTSMRGTVVVRGTAIATASPIAAMAGHLVDSAYQEARPDRLPADDANGPAYLAASVAIALAAIARLAWLLRHT